MTTAVLPRRPLWQAALLGGIPPMLAAWLIAVVIRQYMIAAMDDAHLFETQAMVRPAATFSGSWFYDIGVMLFWFAVAFLAVQFLLFVIMTVAERRRIQPPVAWLCAGVAATTPLVAYGVWPEATAISTWQILIVYAFGVAAAWFTRRLRHGKWEL